MKKLEIVYKTKGEFHCEETEMRMSFVKPIAELWVGTKEKEKLEKLVKWIENDLRKRTWLSKEEKLEISKFNKYVIEYESQINKRIDSKVYNICKKAYQLVEEGKTTWEQLIKSLEKTNCSKCIKKIQQKEEKV